MIRFILRIYDALSRRRWLPVTLLIGLFILCLLSLSRIHYQEDISAFLPVDTQAEEYMDVYTELGGQDRIAVIFSGDSTALIPAMDAFRTALTDADTVGMVRDLQVTVDESRMTELMGYLWQTYPLLLTDADLARIDSLLTSGGYVRRQLEENRRLLMLPFGSVVTQSIPSDPLHLSTPLTGRLQANPLATHYRILDSHLFSREDGKGIVLLSTPYGISESEQNKQLVDLLDRVSADVMASYPGVNVSSIGAPVIAVGNASRIKTDSILAVSLSVLLIFGILYYSFRRWNDIGWIGVSVVFGWVVALGIISLFYDQLSIIVLGIGSVMIGIAVNYPLHYLDHLRHEPDRRTALKEMITPLLIGNVTTVSAFLCLVFIKAAAMRDLGIFCSLMLVSTIAFVLLLLPPLVSRRIPGGKVSYIVPDVRVKLPIAMRRAMFPVVLLLTVILGYFSLGTSFDSDMQHINYMTPEQRADLKQLFTSVQANDSLATVFLVTRGDSLDAALQANEALLDIVRDNPEVKTITGLDGLIPSSTLAKQRMDRWTALWQRHTEALDTLRTEAARLDFAPTAFTPFLTLCEGQPLQTGQPNLFYELLGRNYVLTGEDSTVRVVNILSVDHAHAAMFKQSLRAAIDHRMADAFVFDGSDVSSSLVTILSNSFNYIGFICGFVVFAFLWLSFGRLELSLIAFLPLAVSWLWILGIMNLFSIQFNIVNIILATFIFGQGDDYSIFITEGLSYEYAYGRQRLKTYRNSVAISAALMFIGIGTLIFAQHPALRSLAQVAIIGMVTVVVMTFYLPPLVFRWLTTRRGVVREVPLTLQRLLYSLWALTFFLVCSIFIFEPYALIQYYFLSRYKRCRRMFHKVLQAISRFVIYRVPGVRYRYVNAVGETFKKPAVIICNHQSHLDVMCLLMMSPKIVILTNDWVWHNPFYGAIIRAAEFLSDGIDKNLQRLTGLVARGYSVVIFPEGTRESGRGIMHFHKGAFQLAQQLKVDILPVIIHGLADVLPKRDFMLRRGQITAEVHQRMTYSELAHYESRALRSYWHKWYVAQYRQMSQQLEDVAYCIPYVEYKYMYKGIQVERRCKKELRRLLRTPSLIEHYKTTEGSYVIHGSGQGEIAWITALIHPDCEVYAYEADPDLHAIAVNTQGLPANLHFLSA